MSLAREAGRGGSRGRGVREGWKSGAPVPRDREKAQGGGNAIYGARLLGEPSSETRSSSAAAEPGIKLKRSWQARALRRCLPGRPVYPHLCQQLRQRLFVI